MKGKPANFFPKVYSVPSKLWHPGQGVAVDCLSHFGLEGFFFTPPAVEAQSFACAPIRDGGGPEALLTDKSTIWGGGVTKTSSPEQIPSEIKQSKSWDS